MQRQDRISILLNFIKTYLCEYVFERGLENLDEKEVLGFTTYEEFLAFQEEKLNSGTNEELTQWETLMTLLPKWQVMAGEDMVPMDSEGFSFDQTGRLVIMMGR